MEKEVGKEALARVMESLTVACQDLESTYGRLNGELQSLRGELARKDMVIESLFSGFPGGVVLASADGKIVYRNPKAASFGGAGDDLPSLLGREAAERVAAAGASPVRDEIRKSDGTVWEMTAVPVAEGGQTLILLHGPDELAGLRGQEERRKRLEGLGEVAANVAHEIRNPLGSMELFASLLAPRLENDPESYGMLEKIRFGISGIERIVSDFLMFAAPPKPRMEPVSLKALVGEIGRFAAPSPAGVSFTADIPNDLMVLGDARMLGQVFLNLTLNAVQAMPDGGTITVSAKRDGAQVLVSFRDTGCGIAPDIMGKVFDPFFTTRQDGSGLGLAIVGNIITLHGGTIAAVPAVGAGAAFEIRLKGI